MSTKKTPVQVTVEWPSRTKVNTLHKGLEFLGKKLCLEAYKQIAGEVWENDILSKHVQQLFLRDVDRECTALCSLKNPSCPRSPNKGPQPFSIAKFNSELETKAPLFSVFFGLPVFARANEKTQSGDHPCACPPLFC